MNMTSSIRGLGANRSSEPQQPVLTVRDLSISFKTQFGDNKVVDGVDLSIQPGEQVAIVGESGSGKSVTSLAIMGLLPSSARVAASAIDLGGVSLLGASDKDMSKIRGADLSMVFQNPLASLNPTMTIGRQVPEAVALHSLSVSREDLDSIAKRLLREVQIPNPGLRARQFPHEFSGGMRQRSVIAMALAGKPRLVIADEPTTALDVTVQAQIVKLLRSLHKKRNMANLIITHDLGLVAELAERVLVMYAGRIVEETTAQNLFDRPAHPYTRALLACRPSILGTSGRLDAIDGRPPRSADAIPGCPFHPRCSLAQDRCKTRLPALEVIDGAHRVACHVTGSAAQQNSSAFGETSGLYLMPLANRSPGIGPDLSGDLGGDLSGDRRRDRGGELEPADVPPAVKAQVVPAQTATMRDKISDLGVEADRERNIVLRLANVTKKFGPTTVVDGVSLDLAQGETLGVAGESGCGKSTLARLAIGLLRPTSGQVEVMGQDMSAQKGQALGMLRRKIQMVFQDPVSSLDPRMTVRAIVSEPMEIAKVKAEKIADRLSDLMRAVGLDESYLSHRPSELSGGQKQRVGIARALALDPNILVLDEPTSALDVSVQAQIINLLEDLRSETKASQIFISHDLALLRHISDRVAIMYLGQIVEIGSCEDVLATPRHPYTRALLASNPVAHPNERRVEKFIALGSPTDAANRPSGCSFRLRCPLASEICVSKQPELSPVSEPGHRVGCHERDNLKLLSSLKI